MVPAARYCNCDDYTGAWASTHATVECSGCPEVAPTARASRRIVAAIPFAAFGVRRWCRLVIGGILPRELGAESHRSRHNPRDPSLPASAKHDVRLAPPRRESGQEIVSDIWDVPTRIACRTRPDRAHVATSNFISSHPVVRAISRDLQATELVDGHHRECRINHWSRDQQRDIWRVRVRREMWPYSIRAEDPR
jgi:hypothetical protein